MRDSIRAATRALTAVALSLATAAIAQQPITLHGAVQFNDDHAFTKALVRFQELVVKYYGSSPTSRCAICRR